MPAYTVTSFLGAYQATLSSSSSVASIICSNSRCLATVDAASWRTACKASISQLSGVQICPVLACHTCGPPDKTVLHLVEVLEPTHLSRRRLHKRALVLGIKLPCCILVLEPCTS